MPSTPGRRRPGWSRASRAAVQPRWLTPRLALCTIPIDALVNLAADRVKLTSRSEYALLALVHLARNADKGFLSVQSIAAAQSVPPRFLEQILLTLKRGRYVRSLKGQRGGFCLARPAGLMHVERHGRRIDCRASQETLESLASFFATWASKRPKTKRKPAAVGVAAGESVR